MSTKATKTIDNLGIQSYIDFEEGRKYLDNDLMSQARNVANRLSSDVFEPMVLSDYQLLFEIDLKGGVWSHVKPPKFYNEQTGRLFTHQLAPKLGPQELIEHQIGKIEEKRDEEKEERRKQKRLSWEIEQEVKEIDKESGALIQMLQNIQILNKIMVQINTERYRFSKG